MQIFKGFFSYAHKDATTDSDLFNDIQSQLQERVAQRLVNANFEIWRDTKKLRFGDKWTDEIAAAVREADVLVLLASPSWMNSEMCQKEYSTFAEVERMAGEKMLPSIVPIIIRSLSERSTHFLIPQQEIYADINSRQYAFKDIVDLKALSQASRAAWIDKIADDIEGIIEKKRSSTSIIDGDSQFPVRFDKTKLSKEFSPKAYDFTKVDYLSEYDLLLRDDPDGAVSIFGQFDFIERLYVSTNSGRVEFGVSRAVLTINDKSGAQIGRADHLRSHGGATRYIQLHESPNALTVGIDPSLGKSTLGQLALPPGPKPDNRHSQIGTVLNRSGLDIEASLTINLNTEGIFILGINGELSNADKSKLQAILSIAASKFKGANSECHVRELEISDERNDK